MIDARVVAVLARCVLRHCVDHPTSLQWQHMQNLLARLWYVCGGRMAERQSIANASIVMHSHLEYQNIFHHVLSNNQKQCDNHVSTQHMCS
jgi:hypothetical protein